MIEAAVDASIYIESKEEKRASMKRLGAGLYELEIRAPEVRKVITVFKPGLVADKARLELEIAERTQALAERTQQLADTETLLAEMADLDKAAKE